MGPTEGDLQLCLSTIWHQALDDFSVTCVIFLDIAGAFDHITYDTTKDSWEAFNLTPTVTPYVSLVTTFT